MPLGLFGGGTSSGKAQVLSSSDGPPSARDRKEGRNLTENNCKGVVLKLTNTTVTIDKQLAEGGFAIVYLVTDRKNRKFALKRQFVLDNQKQLEACNRECKIVSQLRGHKNIVEYVDHVITQNKYGQFDCMLLTVFHKRNVLQLMNERISSGMHLATSEVFSIFCDMCEAVARLHHTQTPVVHRDLKVENILIDERNRAAPPVYVLCDFGSATNKVMSISTHSAGEIQEEIERNTTLCYRSPEMIDIYGSQPIGIKSDMWSMGVMLYRLCYFALPFEESALAIQNGNYTIPTQPSYPAALKSLIYLLLDADVNRRLSIFECSSLAFEASGKQCPVDDVHKIGKPSLENAIVVWREGMPRNERQNPSPAQSQRPKTPESELISTTEAPTNITSTTTSVNPRLRPKATSVLPTVPNITPSPAPSPRPGRANVSNLGIGDVAITHPRRETRLPSVGNVTQLEPVPNTEGPLSCPLLKPSDLGFTDLDSTTVIRNRAATDSLTYKERQTVSPTSAATDSSMKDMSQHHRRHVSDTSHIVRSAFKPYSQTSNAKSSQVQSVEDVRTNKTGNPWGGSGEWNPFLAAPFSGSSTRNDNGMDDTHFGECFDELPRREKEKFFDFGDDDGSSIDSHDPFGAAPFDHIAAVASSCRSTKPPPAEGPKMNQSIEEKTDVDGKRQMTEDDSEVDEQRMRARRRYSYENIDGVGDDASSDSRGRTDRDDSEDLETDEHSRNGGGDTSHDEEDGGGSSQNTVGSEDGEGGNRPLLEDDGLEDDDDHELLSSYRHIAHLQAPLFVDASRATTNPFLRTAIGGYDETPKMLSPANQQEQTTVHNNSFIPNWDNEKTGNDYWDPNERWNDRRDTMCERPAFASIQKPEAATEFAPATLPRQATPLSAVPRYKPDLPSAAPVSIIPSMSTTSFPEVASQSEETNERCEPVVGTLIQVGAPTIESKNMALVEVRANVPPTVPVHNNVTPQVRKVSGQTFVEGPKTPRGNKHRKTKEEKKWKTVGDGNISTDGPSDPETDGSEAEMCVSSTSEKAAPGGGGTTSKKKKKPSSFGLRSSHPSIVANDLQFVTPTPPVVKKSSKKGSSSVKRTSTGALNASFVNSSFQCEDIDSSPSHCGVYTKHM